MMNRRQMLVAGSGGLALATVGLGEGCNAASWIQTALNDLPIVVQIAESIISIVAAAQGSADPAALGVAQTAANAAKQALLEAQSFVAQYNSTKTGTLLGNIDAALTTAQSQLGAILAALHITNQTLAATLAAAIGSGLTIVVAIQALVPAPPAATSARAALHTSTMSAIKTAYNESVTAAGGAQYAVR